MVANLAKPGPTAKRNHHHDSHVGEVASGRWQS